MAIEPSAVTIQDSSEIAPTLAMFVGSMMIPEPIMFTATMNVSWIRLIFFFVLPWHVSPRDVVESSLADDVRVKPDATVDAFLVHPLDLVVEAREAIERLFERHEVVEHRLGPVVPSLARARRRRCPADR